MKTVAVIGGTGQMGSRLVQRLVGLGHHVRVLTRSTPKARSLFGSSVEPIEGDLLEAKDLKALVEGITHLFAVHGADNCLGERGYELVHYGGLDKALESIPGTQDTHVIYLSCLNTGRKGSLSVPFSDPAYWIGLTERMVQNSGFPYTIIRPVWLRDDHRGGGQEKPSQSNQSASAASWDVVEEALVKAMDYASAKGKVFEVSAGEGAPSLKGWDHLFSEPIPEEEMLRLWPCSGKGYGKQIGQT